MFKQQFVIKLVIISILYYQIILLLFVPYIETTTAKVNLLPTWEEYKEALNKTYQRKFREVRSKEAFLKNVEIVKKHNEEFNLGKTTFKLAINPLADLSNREYLIRYVRLSSSLHRKTATNANNTKTNDEDEFQVGFSLFPFSLSLPKEFDWREKGFITPPSNQKSCGSCYAFSIAHTIEGQIFKKSEKLLPLSVQQIVDCSVANGNQGCAGGSLRNSLRYLQSCGGLMKSTDYSYTSSQGHCRFMPLLSVVNISSWAILPSKDENALKKAIATIGPVAVSINASPSTFQLYDQGIYDDSACSSNTVNHAMLAVGYTEDYWILKNWWGIQWGESGYMKLRRHRNLCGVSNFAAYVVI